MRPLVKKEAMCRVRYLGAEIGSGFSCSKASDKSSDGSVAIDENILLFLYKTPQLRIPTDVVKRVRRTCHGQ